MHLFGKEYGMFRLRGLPLVALLTPLTLAAAPKGKGDGLTQKEIVDVIQSHNNDAVACYKEATAEDKSAEGRVKIRFLIGLNGKIEASQVEQNTFKNKAIGNCIRTRMKAWKFPKPRGGQKISIAYPFEFKVAPPPPPAPETPATAPATAPSAPTAPGTPESPATAPAVPPTPPTPEAPEAPSTQP
jgi:TonB family protein